MPYDNLNDLPKQVKDNLPKEAQKIYKEAFNNAYDEYSSGSKRKGSSSREETAHKVAWNAVKKKYHKNDDGDWVKKAA
jgi:cation transport regulator